MQRNWPDQLAIGVVEAVDQPPAPPSEGKNNVSYYSQTVRPVDWIFLRWLSGDPQSPADRFRIHYWFRPADGERALKIGEQYIAFLAPAKAQGIFVTDMLLTATKESISEVRHQLRNAKW